MRQAMATAQAMGITVQPGLLERIGHAESLEQALLELLEREHLSNELVGRLVDEQVTTLHAFVQQLREAPRAIGVSAGRGVQLIDAAATLEIGGTDPNDRFEPIRYLGRGTGGETLLALRRSTGERVVLKRILARTVDEANRALAEARRLLTLRHCLVVSAHEVFEDVTLGLRRINIVMEYCDRGDLEHVAAVESPLGVERVMVYLTTILAALDFIHSQGVAQYASPPLYNMTTHGSPSFPLSFSFSFRLPPQS